MAVELRQRFNASVVFAFCEGCAVLLACFVEPRLLYRWSQLAVGYGLAVVGAAAMAPLISRLWRSAHRSDRLKLIACGALLGCVAIVAMGAAEAGRAEQGWLAGALQRSGVQLSWYSWLGLWFDRLVPTAAVLFVLAGAFAARLFGQVSCPSAA